MKTPEQELIELKQSFNVLSNLREMTKILLKEMTDRYKEENQLRKQLQEELDELRREFRLFQKQHPPEETVMF